MNTTRKKFNPKHEDWILIEKIAARAITHPLAKLKKIDVLMDIEATHNNGCPLRLSDLWAADNFNFFHDIFGIRRHLNRTTKKLEDCFVPRFAK